jgi:hypothetical protein
VYLLVNNFDGCLLHPGAESSDNMSPTSSPFNSRVGTPINSPLLGGGGAARTAGDAGKHRCVCYSDAVACRRPCAGLLLSSELFLSVEASIRA